MKIRHAVLFVSLVSAAALAQRPPAPVAPVAPVAPAPPAAPAMPPLPPMNGPMFGLQVGIPPAVAQRAGIPADTVKKVRDLSFEANEALIPLEADLKRAQLDLEKTLAQNQVDETQVGNKLEVVSRAELAVRKNRMGLMVRIRKLVGPDAWEKVQAEMAGPDRVMLMGMPGPGGMRREVRVIRTSDGAETVDVTE